MTIGKGFVTQTAFKKHLDGDWRTVHDLWRHIRNYMTSYAQPGGDFTQGSVAFYGSDGFLTEDNANFFWDDTNNRLGIMTNTPTAKIDITAAGTEPGINISAAANGEMSTPDGEQFRWGHWNSGTTTFTERLKFDAAGVFYVSYLTIGSVIFAGAGGEIKQDNAKLNWDDANDRLGIGGAASNALHVSSVGTTAGGTSYGGVVAQFNCTESKHTSIAINANGGYDPVLYFSEGGSGIWDLRNDASATDKFQIRYQVGEVNRTDFQIDNAGNVTISGTINGAYLSVEATNNYVWSNAIPPGFSGAVGNICIGYASGQAITSGDYNVVIGYETGQAFTDDGQNVLIGYRAGRAVNDAGITIIGGQAGTQTTGIGITAIGFYALRTGAAGQQNTAVGSQCLQVGGGVSYNTAVGYLAGSVQSTGAGNVYVGAEAGRNDDGTGNSYFGRQAGKNIGTAASAYNVAIGYQCMVGVLSAETDGNIGVGYRALYVIDGGDYNMAFGYTAGYALTSGSSNVFIGNEAGYKTTTPDNNVFLGYRSGYDNVTGANNMFLGALSGEDSTGSGNVCIGYQAGSGQLAGDSNELWIANSNTATPLIYGEFDNAYLLINGTLAVAYATIGDDERGLSTIHTLTDNPAKSDGIAFYSEGHIGAITTDGPTYGAGIWLNIDAGATLGADVRALDIGIYEAGADCAGGNAYGLAIHMEFDDTDPPAAIYPFRINCNDTPGHAIPAALIFAPNRSAIALIDAAPGTADDAYLKIKLQDGSVYRIPLVKE